MTTNQVVMTFPVQFQPIPSITIDADVTTTAISANHASPAVDASVSSISVQSDHALTATGTVTTTALSADVTTQPGDC